MKRFITFGSIDQFRTIVKNVKRAAQFVSYDDETKEVTIDKEARMPSIEFSVSEKIHGTNAGVSYSNPDGIWFQSRKNIITPEKDNAGCAFFMESKEEVLLQTILDLAISHKVDLNENIITLYGEWSGGSIQKKSACTGLDKRFIIFEYFKVSPIEAQLANDGTELSAYWKQTCLDYEVGVTPEKWVNSQGDNIFNIMNFPTQKYTINFERPDIHQNEMLKMVEEIEKESLVGKLMGIDGNIGEGFVLQCMYKDTLYRFKIKGEEHSKGTGKVRTLKPVDEEKENKKIKFVNEIACTESRLQQMFTEIVHSVHNGDETEMSMKDMGKFLSLVVKDVIKEHAQDMIDAGLVPKPLNNKISEVSRRFFKTKLYSL